jgi:hypothetical protein
MIQSGSRLIGNNNFVLSPFTFLTFVTTILLVRTVRCRLDIVASLFSFSNVLCFFCRTSSKTWLQYYPMHGALPAGLTIEFFLPQKTIHPVLSGAIHHRQQHAEKSKVANIQILKVGYDNLARQVSAIKISTVNVSPRSRLVCPCCS